jgi:DNA repair protein SbcC/Rad50
LSEHRAELRIRLEVADALSAYRESVSRRARPQLEQETALLLGHTTRGRYNSVQLSDAYHLEIADGRTLYPVRRFSGGEQDLAALCLRLALSRMLARQRGAETGFVLLDEVFGSQDVDRRRALLEQLHRLAENEFRQVFVISHTDDVVELCDLNVIVARGENGISTASGPHR